MLQLRLPAPSMPAGLIVATALSAWACSTSPGVPEQNPAADLATRIADAHGREAWSQQDALRARIQINIGGTKVVDGVFTFETDGTRVRHERADGATVIFDGETAWLDSTSEPRGQERFHLLTWPWVVAAPFRTQTGADVLSDRTFRPLLGTWYDSFRQTFIPSAGGSPDDWYLMYARLEDGEPILDSIGYLVTYGGDVTSAKPSLMRYRGYGEFDGVRLARRYELWQYDPESGQLLGSTWKAIGFVGDLEFLPLDERWFEVPENAIELPVPRVIGPSDRPESPECKRSDKPVATLALQAVATPSWSVAQAVATSCASIGSRRTTETFSSAVCVTGS